MRAAQQRLHRTELCPANLRDVFWVSCHNDRVGAPAARPTRELSLDETGVPHDKAFPVKKGGKMTTQEKQKPVAVRPGGGADAVYGIGMIGAWVFYFKRAETTQERIRAFFKGIVWPAFLVHDLLEFLENE
jgi:hypothetical protein